MSDHTESRLFVLLKVMIRLNPLGVGVFCATVLTEVAYRIGVYFGDLQEGSEWIFAGTGAVVLLVTSIHKYIELARNRKARRQQEENDTDT